jgi:hypothetical protein
MVLLYTSADIAHGGEVVQWIAPEYQKARLIAGFEPPDLPMRKDGLGRRSRPDL